MERLRIERAKKAINAIVDRDNGVPYKDAIANNGVTPSQFFARVIKYPETTLSYADRRAKKRLEEILFDEERKKELFNMGEECIKDQYRRIQEGSLRKFYDGVFLHPENVNEIAYWALVYHNPMLRCKTRVTVVQGFEKLFEKIRGGLERYLQSIHLTGLMMHGFDEIKNSSLAVLDVFDRMYQRKSGDKFSLFDLKQDKHLHKWGYIRAYRSFWDNPDNIEIAIYHTLTELHPELKSENRAEIVRAFEQFPADISTYLQSVGLSGAMRALPGIGEKESGIAVIKVFDKVYQKTMNDDSLFDASQKFHLKLDGKNRLIRQQAAYS